MTNDPVRGAARPAFRGVALAVALACGALPWARAQQAAPASPAAATPAPTLDELNRRINDQVRRLAELRRSMEAQEATLQEMRRTVAEQLLAAQRSAGGTATTAAAPTTATVATGTTATPASTSPAAMEVSTVGRAPATSPTATKIAPIFEEPGVLTPRGHGVLEPAISYSYSSNNRVTLLGYSVLPALIVGLVDVREVRRNTVTAALTGRYGITNRFEVEARIPYVYRSDTTRTRPVGAGSATDIVIGASGSGVGDIELAARYQLTSGSSGWPFMIGSLRFKSRTGKDPFEVVSDCTGKCDLSNSTDTGQPLTLPTGSGFYSLQPGLTWLLPSDPAVLFGSFTYTHNFKRNDVSRRVLNGESELIGSVAPGGVFGFNVGIGLALNDKSSFSVGYDHSSIGVTKVNGETVPGSVRTQLGTLAFGYSYRLSSTRSLNFSLGAGLTADTPNLTLTLRTPVAF